MDIFKAGNGTEVTLSLNYRDIGMISAQIVDDHRILVDGMLRLINESGVAR